MISISALPLLAYKAGPNLFDLSSNLHQISIRDQQHRAVALVEALVAGKQLDSNEQVLIIGAGVAGIVAGIVLARHGISVQIVDSSDSAPFSLQRNVTKRYVGPYMYEWPLSVYKSQEMPPPSGSVLAIWGNGKSAALPFKNVAPVTPDHLVAKVWDKALLQEINSSAGKLRLQIGINRDETSASVKGWLDKKRSENKESSEVKVIGGSPWRNTYKPFENLKPSIVILAAGMGAETCVLKNSEGVEVLNGKPFWGDDTILELNCGLEKKPQVVVIGGGDGALQDVLRAVTSDEHPLITWDRLSNVETGGELEQALATIQVLEAQHALTTIWTVADSQETTELDKGYQDLAMKLACNNDLRSAVIESLRDDVVSVSLCVKDRHFSKAYALNRFLVHLVEQCVEKCKTCRYFPPGRATLDVYRGVEVKNSTNDGGVNTLYLSNNESITADIVIVRFGADVTGSPRQWLGLVEKDTENRQELSRVLLPLYLPPTK